MALLHAAKGSGKARAGVMTLCNLPVKEGGSSDKKCPHSNL
jgi:hypothetical protein